MYTVLYREGEEVSAILMHRGIAPRLRLRVGGHAVNAVVNPP